MTIQYLKERGEEYINEEHWPDAMELAAYIAFVLKRPITVLKIEGHEGTELPGSFIGVHGYLASIDDECTARPSKWPHPARARRVHPHRVITAF